ncbi:hypothetical protein M427DRAFT_57196 [Gonapodya prolifera JEL478]|uniref:Uncharacterized protein n=1 Tax=Gonapodya prolifera (strain JEL478) TaxID=1344416 RepID=A0A139AED3_GONPJ|nr:hypothetical protein M427DRAFT_57196 [Gonapodya prolifera JEL478]|eukprot:KXS14783.1 hypothetical protein M427DRAFT_57196 [Gonapodya prolifera JEL478]
MPTHREHGRCCSCSKTPGPSPLCRLYCALPVRIAQLVPQDVWYRSATSYANCRERFGGVSELHGWSSFSEPVDISPILARQTCGFLATTPIGVELVDQIQQEVGALKVMHADAMKVPGHPPLVSKPVLDQSLENMYYLIIAFMALVKTTGTFPRPFIA